MSTLVAERTGVWELSFDDFFRAEYPLVYKACYLSTGSDQAAQDIVQEAFARAYARWKRLSREPWAGGWVMTTAMNLCKGHHRNAAKTTGNDASSPEGTVREPDGVRLDLSSALIRLPIRQRTATVLFYLCDLAVPQIALLMEINEGTVKAHLAQARRSLREALGEDDD